MAVSTSTTSVPLAAAELRQPDLFVAGSVSFDLVFAGIAARPAPGREVHAADLGGVPGGVATVAVTAARLGAQVVLACGFAFDAYGDFLWETLVREGVDLSCSTRWEGWSTPVSVSLADSTERSLVTYERPPAAGLDELLGTAPAARAVVVPLSAISARQLGSLRDAGSVVLADVSWEVAEAWHSGLSERLASVDIFTPNATEAGLLTGTADPEAALEELRTQVAGTVVVKCGSRGALAASGEEVVWEPAIGVEAIDTTGAGDIFDAAFLMASLAELDLQHSLRFANLIAGLSTRCCGSSLSAPCWSEVWTWYKDSQEPVDYQFLLSLQSPSESVEPCFHGGSSFPSAGGSTAISA